MVLLNGDIKQIMLYILHLQLEMMVLFIAGVMMVTCMLYIQSMELLSGNIKQVIGWDEDHQLQMMEQSILVHGIVIFMLFILMER